MGLLVPNLAAVLLAGALLGVAVWVGGIGVLAWLVSRPVLGSAVIVRAVGALVATAALYVAVAVMMRLVLPEQ